MLQVTILQPSYSNLTQSTKKKHKNSARQPSLFEIPRPPSSLRDAEQKGTLPANLQLNSTPTSNLAICLESTKKSIINMILFCKMT